MLRCYESMKKLLKNLKQKFLNEQTASVKSSAVKKPSVQQATRFVVEQYGDVLMRLKDQ